MSPRNLLAFVYCIPILLLLLPLVMPQPLYYEQPPIRLNVIDSHGKKISGAVVVASWATEGGSFHTYNAGYLAQQIAITDENGEFRLPGWEKRWNEWGLNRRVLQTDQPELVIYKFGYLPTKIFNTSDGISKPTLIWQVKGPLILNELHGSPAEAYKLFSENSGPLLRVMPSLFIGCEWKNFRPLLIEFDKQEQVAEELNLNARQIGVPDRPWYLEMKNYFNLEFPGKEPDCPGGIEWLASERLKQKKINAAVPLSTGNEKL